MGVPTQAPWLERGLEIGVGANDAWGASSAARSGSKWGSNVGWDGGSNDNSSGGWNGGLERGDMRILDKSLNLKD